MKSSQVPRAVDAAPLKRAQTAAARLSAVVLPRVIDSVHDKVAPHPLALAKPTESHIYRLEAAQRLPVTNLRLTLSYVLLNPAKNLAFLKWVKRHFRLLTLLNRAGLLIGMASIAVPRTLAPFFVVPACLLTLPASCCSYAMLSVDLGWILLKHYEFWFFSVINLCTWSALAALCQDVRVLFLVIACLDTEQMILMDANFRTFVPAVKTCAFAIPVLLGLAALVFLRQLDLPSHQIASLRIGKLQIELTEIFLNAILTLLLFLLRKVYNKRKLLFKRHASSRVVRCMILRCVLQVSPLTTHSALHVVDGGEIQPLKRAYGTSVVLKKLGITAQKVVPGMRAGRVLNSRQQLTLISLRLSTIDSCKTLHPRWWEIQHLINTCDVALFYGVGVLGLLLSGGSMLVPGESDPTALISLPHVWKMAIPMLSFACTSIFCSAFACAYQRDFARAMLRNFGFLFPSLQFSLAAVCLADAMEWDSRCWAIGSYCLWFHWILLLDTLTPPTRKQLRFRKQFAVPVVIAVWIGMLSVLYAIVVDSPTLSNRVLIHWRLGLHDITTGTKTILLNRVLTILLWTFRLVWQILRARDTELVLIRGTLDYYCPFDTFTGSVRGGSMKVVLPAGARRDSEGSAVLLASTEISAGRRRSSLTRSIRRVSTFRHLPISPDAQLQPLTSNSSPANPQPASSLVATLLQTDDSAVSVMPVTPRPSVCAPLHRSQVPSRKSPTIADLNALVATSRTSLVDLASVASVDVLTATSAKS